jgi:protocatechuate 3,4-dioxygenase, alpha subunit
MTLPATTSQTVGPFFRIGFKWLYVDNLAGEGARGDKVEISGRVLDADGQPIPDAMLELWQANAHGKYAHPDDAQEKSADPAFSGFGRIPTEEDGTFRFTTIKPGQVPGPNGKLQAPHIVVSVFMRGLLRRLVTRIYFPDEPSNHDDFALNLVEPDRRSTLIARKSTTGGAQFEWNIIMQGPDETVFFDC